MQSAIAQMRMQHMPDELPPLDVRILASSQSPYTNLYCISKPLGKLAAYAEDQIESHSVRMRSNRTLFSSFGGCLPGMQQS